MADDVHRKTVEWLEEHLDLIHEAASLGYVVISRLNYEGVTEVFFYRYPLLFRPPNFPNSCRCCSCNGPVLLDIWAYRSLTVLCPSCCRHFSDLSRNQTQNPVEGAMPEKRDSKIRNTYLAAEIAGKGWNYTAMAKAAGTSCSTISRLVCKPAIPRLKTAYAIADALGVPVGVLGWGLEDHRTSVEPGKLLSSPSSGLIYSKPPPIQPLLLDVAAVPPVPTPSPTRLLSSACDLHLVLLAELGCSDGYSQSQVVEMKMMASRILVFIQSTHTSLLETGS